MNLSVDGKTRDLHGVDENKLPPGFKDKLYNNVINAERDISGNNELWYEFNGNLVGQTIFKDFYIYNSVTDTIEPEPITKEVGWLLIVTV